ncbi:hypothetical protein [Kordia sp.]|uniref:hypothetical protein n=1 Tax=Kordia sp. TaxID=1965332 RepID=UPI003B59641C
MKKFLKFSLILALAVFTFSCSNDNTDVIPEEESTGISATLKSNLTTHARTAVATNQVENVFENNSESNAECFTIDFPYSFENAGVVIVINNQAELDAYLQNNNSPVGGPGTLVFPVTVTLADGSSVVVNDEMGLIAIIEDCIDDIDVGNECFSFNFPLTVETADGNTVVVNDELELYSVPNAVGFVFPITVTTANGVVTINDNAGFDALYNECYDIDPCDDCGTNCFEIVFPLTLVDDSGNIVTVNDEDEFLTYLNNPAGTAGTFFTITYPMTIEYADGTQATINSDDELTAAFDACN